MGPGPRAWAPGSGLGPRAWAPGPGPGPQNPRPHGRGDKATPAATADGILEVQAGITAIDLKKTEIEEKINEAKKGVFLDVKRIGAPPPKEK